MRTLILIRHGQDEGSRLSESGRRTIERLSEKLLELVGDARRFILSSTAGRATQTAGILADRLACDMRAEQTFFSGGGTDEDLPKGLELIRAAAPETDVLLVVTHYEYVQHMPAYFATHELQTPGFPRQVIGKGEAWVIDCEAKSIAHVAV